MKKPIEKPDARVAATFAAQHSLITATQVRAAGITKKQRQHRLEVGRWRKERRGVYALEGAPRTKEQRVMAMVLGAPPGAMAGGRCALSLRGMLRMDEMPLEVTIRRGKNHAVSGARVRQRADIRPTDITMVGVIPCATVEFAIAEVAGELTVDELEDLVDEALCAGRCLVDDLQSQAERLPRNDPGRRGLSDVLAVWGLDGAPQSAYELKIARGLLAQGIDGLVFQHPILDRFGKTVAVVDLARPAFKTAIEYDSFRWHAGRRGHASTNQRRNRIVALGWDVLAATKADTDDGCAALATQVRALERFAAS